MPTDVDSSLTAPVSRRASAGEIGSPGLAVVSSKAAGDGIGYVGRLLHLALRDLSGDEPLFIAVEPARGDRVSGVERLRFATKLLAAHARRGTDWWMYNHVGIARVADRFPRLVRQPYGVFLYGIEAWAANLSPDRLRTLQNAKLRIAISRHTSDRALRAQPQMGRIDACPLGLLDPAGELGPPDVRVIERVHAGCVLIVGRMSERERYKGHDQLLECWSNVLAKCPAAQLVVVGTGDDLPRLQMKAARLGVSPSVLFTGFVSEATLAGIWKRAGVFAMPSAGEGFGLVYLEAMRESVPCIGSTEDAAGDIIASGETGLLVDRSDHNEIAGALMKLLENADLRGRMGEAGRKLFESEFTYDCFVARLKPILQSAFGPGASKHQSELRK